MPTYKRRDSIHGDGIMDDISNFGKKVIGGVKEGASKVGDYFSRVANMKKEIPPNVKRALDEIGEKSITSARIGRTPVQALVQGALRTIADVPYDNLFHLFIELTVDGRKYVLEKIERITLLAEDRSQKQGAEFTDSFQVRGTVNELFVNTQTFMGKRFLPYQSNSNNCQVFIDSVLTANELNTPTLQAFVKQDTRSIFKNNPILRKFANTLTDIGGYFNALLQGGGMNNGLSDTELEAICDHFDIKLNGIYEKSELTELPYGNYIINLNGQSHWCGMIVHPKGNFYFDSYGFPAPENLQHLMKDYVWCDKQIQDIKSTACGYYVVAFLKFMECPSKQMFNAFCDIFNTPKNNDKVLLSILT